MFSKHYEDVSLCYHTAVVLEISGSDYNIEAQSEASASVPNKPCCIVYPVTNKSFFVNRKYPRLATKFVKKN